MQPSPAPLPGGFEYRTEFLSSEEERALVAEIARLPFEEIRMYGVTAKRRVVHTGWLYGFQTWKVTPGPPIPEFLLPVRERLAEMVEKPPQDLAEALVMEYPPGAGIGWHRDAPVFGLVVAVSLAGSCRLRFQSGKGAERRTAELLVEPRSAYALTGEARTKWQHSIPPVKELRYSITFRTLRRRAVSSPEIL
ncbi:MAG TPA: alpha-ketoglutarate-dependent dioxygenase AlkB [Bryobacteraceae bacterium]|nr:alpha-ketoglutarate-dependent dioxygenase AlkB [Bryobacteraceae bacterium]